ncbi:MAG: tRNA pseudouridine(38-40) synthase TruA, partial [Rothia sp. (in: high G+C Gram-positive bacteria)]|nr:tRNA pseudouridine(38-40) synthase TruA [Rothia sp. (in: high G+C Gram-positive bacteria)]
MDSAEPADTYKQRVRIDLAYDGAPFAGWAKQPGLVTV